MVARSGPRISRLYFQYKPRVIPVVGNLFTTAGCKRILRLVAGRTYNSGGPQVAHPWVIQTKAVVITANKVKPWPTCVVIVLIIHKNIFILIFSKGEVYPQICHQNVHTYHIHSHVSVQHVVWLIKAFTCRLIDFMQIFSTEVDQ